MRAQSPGFLCDVLPTAVPLLAVELPPPLLQGAGWQERSVGWEKHPMATGSLVILRCPQT